MAVLNCDDDESGNNEGRIVDPISNVEVVVLLFTRVKF